MDLLRSAIDCNCKALHLLGEGKLQESQSDFRKALAIMRQIGTGDGDTNDAVRLARDSLRLESIVIPCTQVDPNRVTGGCVFPLFNRGMGMLPPDLNAPVTETVVGKASILLLYNYALSLHLLGIQLGSSKYIRSALRIYEMATTVLLSDTPVGADEDLSVLLVATLNNMGHIYENLLIDNQAAATCFRLIEEMAPAIATVEESSFFCRTLIIFDLWPSPPASAA